jgi:phage-related minor tail protein
MANLAEVGLVATIVTDALEKGGKVVQDVLGKTNKELEETEDSSAGAGGALDVLGGVASGVATGGLTLLIGAVAAVGTALVGTATAGLKFATEFGGVMRDVEAQTGATGAELENFRNITEEVYQTGLGESFADVAQAMVQVEQVTGTAGEELQTLTANALTMSQVFDVDVGESVRAVDQAMIAFGADGTDVFDMMTTTIQATGDPMDDLADTINEYSRPDG